MPNQKPHGREVFDPAFWLLNRPTDSSFGIPPFCMARKIVLLYPSVTFYPTPCPTTPSTTHTHSKPLSRWQLEGRKARPQTSSTGLPALQLPPRPHTH